MSYLLYLAIVIGLAFLNAGVAMLALGAGLPLLPTVALALVATWGAVQMIRARMA